METIRLVRDLIAEGLNAGEATTKGGLTVVPLFGGAIAKEYVLAEQAFAVGSFTVTERGQGSVPELLAINEGGLPVLLVDGEQLEGAKQNRVLNASVLIPAHSKTTIPVACVEQGRWDTHPTGDSKHSSDHAYPRLRNKNAGTRAGAMRAGAGLGWTRARCGTTSPSASASGRRLRPQAQ